MMKDLYLLIPQWQGGVYPSRISDGAELLYEKFASKYSMEKIAIEEDFNLEAEKHIQSYAEVLKSFKRICNTIQEQSPDRIFTLGGDCSVDMGPISYLNKKYDGDYCVFWVDAHGDLNTPESSPSKRLHGMPIRKLLGQGEDTFINSLFSTIKPDQVTMAGVRDFDAPEKEYVSQAGIHVFSVDEIKNHTDKIVSYLKEKPYSNYHIHVDLDVLDPADFQHVMCPTLEGIMKQNLFNLLQSLFETLNVVGFTLTEFAPTGQDREQGLKTIEDILNIGFPG